jgi:hypothetical protein
MRRLLYTTITIAAACLLGGCITEFTPDITTDHQSLLVVEGTIVDGETVITLNWSEGLYDDEEEGGIIGWGYDGFRIMPPTGATVTIEGEGGERFEAVETTYGEYRATGVTLDNNTRYRLHISLDGENYASQWRLPQATPPIESIDFHEKDGMVQVRVNVTGEPGGPRHYRWSYEETWEIRATIMAQSYFGMYEGDYSGYSLGAFRSSEGELKTWSYPGYQSPFYYCWGYDRSRQLLLGSTDLLTTNTLRDHVLYEFAVSHNRISQLYHTKIYQYAIGEEAYYYLENLKSNTDDTGSIFAPVPSEMEGNIECLTSPEVPVIGFVEVSRLVEREIFLPSNESPYQAPLNTCVQYSYTELMEMAAEAGEAGMYLLYDYYPVSISGNSFDGSSFSTPLCIDCRNMGGTKVRPSWWPNNHF